MDSSKDQVLALIRDNPFISQQDLATRLGLSRSAVAGHVARLTRERLILGRAYVLPAADHALPIVCIGGSNVDRKLRSLGPLTPGSSNPASQTESAGGVARNAAENLARLGLPTQLLTAVGDDASGRALLEQTGRAGVDCGASLRLAGECTGSYTAVLDAGGELVLAMAQMSLCDRLTPELLRQSAAQRRQARLLLADLNLPAASLAALVAEAAAQPAPDAPAAPPLLILLAVSVAKMERLPRRLSGVHLLMLNEAELAALDGRPLDSAESMRKAWHRLRRRGLRHLIVTLGARGLLYSQGEALLALAAPQVRVVDVTGAGDAFAAGVCASLYRDAEDLALACRHGLSLAALTLQTEATVHPAIGPDILHTLSHER